MKTIRKPFEELKQECSGFIVNCLCGQMIDNFTALFNHWQLGHFDTIINEESELEQRIKRAEERISSLEVIVIRAKLI